MSLGCLPKFFLSACRFENSMRKISRPRQCRDHLESVALGAGVVAASSREDYGVAPPTEVKQLWRELLFALFVAFASPVNTHRHISLMNNLMYKHIFLMNSAD